jgi:hypothetical protein
MIERAYPQYFTPDATDNPAAIELFSRVYRPGWAGQGWEYPSRPRSNDGPKTSARQSIVQALGATL